MPRRFPLAEQVDGMSLLRIKGGANPKSLYLLKNGWITSKRTIQARPGSVKELTFPVGTVGVIGHKGKFHTFSSSAVAGTYDARIVVNILRHPTGGGAPLTTIHKAFVFLGQLYVVAEFLDGVVWHYYIENVTPWVANTATNAGGSVQPTTPNGYYYENLTASAVLAWQANIEVTVGQSKQPTAANNLRYQITAVTGPTPTKTGNTEPTWPTTPGATVVERRYVTETTQVDPGQTTPTPAPTGGGPSDYEPYPDYCVTVDMLLAEGCSARMVRVGYEFDCHKPELGFYRGTIAAVGIWKLENCVRLTTPSGAMLECSRSTPFTLPGAESDLQDGMTFRAPEMLGREAYTDTGIERVISVDDIGLRWVVPITFQGHASFAAGRSASNRIYSHNIRKGP